MNTWIFVAVMMLVIFSFGYITEWVFFAWKRKSKKK